MSEVSCPRFWSSRFHNRLPPEPILPLRCCTSVFSHLAEIHFHLNDFVLSLCLFLPLLWSFQKKRKNVWKKNGTTHDISCKQRIPRLRYIFQVLEQETTTLTLLPSAEAFSSTKYSVFLRIPQVRPSGAGRSRTPICVDVQIQDFTPDLPVILRRKTREEMRRSI